MVLVVCCASVQPRRMKPQKFFHDRLYRKESERPQSWETLQVGRQFVIFQYLLCQARVKDGPGVRGWRLFAGGQQLLTQQAGNRSPASARLA